MFTEYYFPGWEAVAGTGLNSIGFAHRIKDLQGNRSMCIPLIFEI